MKLYTAFVAVLVSVFSVACTATRVQSFDRLDPSVSAGIDSVALKAINDTIIPGAVVCVVNGEDIDFLKAYGNISVVPDTVAMTVDAVFDLASLSKCVGTTMAVMQLIENGEIGLLDTVSRYFPDFVMSEGAITVRDLLTHTSGIDAYSNVPRCVAKFGPGQPDSLMHHIATDTGRHFVPGEKFLYSCLNFVTLQNIVQQVTGERLCDYVQANVFDPLGLKHTAYLPLTDYPIAPVEIGGAPIAPTELQEDGLPLRGAVHDPLARVLNLGNSGNAGVFSNASDLAVICQSLMNEDGRILKPETVRLMATVPEENDPAVGRCLGWDVRSSHSGICGKVLPESGHRILCHTGYTGTSIVMDLDSRVAVIVLTNRVHPYDTGGLKATRAAISDLVFGSLL